MHEIILSLVVRERWWRHQRHLHRLSVPTQRVHRETRVPYIMLGGTRLPCGVLVLRDIFTAGVQRTWFPHNGFSLAFLMHSKVCRVLARVALRRRANVLQWRRVEALWALAI